MSILKDVFIFCSIFNFLLSDFSHLFIIFLSVLNSQWIWKGVLVYFLNGRWWTLRSARDTPQDQAKE